MTSSPSGTSVTKGKSGDFLLAKVESQFRSEVLLNSSSSSSSLGVQELAVKTNGSDVITVRSSKNRSLEIFVNGVPLSDHIIRKISDDGENITLECLHWLQNCRRVNASEGQVGDSTSPVGISVHRMVSVVVYNRTHSSIVFASGYAVDVELDELTSSLALTVSVPASAVNKTCGILHPAEVTGSRNSSVPSTPTLDSLDNCKLSWGRLYCVTGLDRKCDYK